LITCFSQAILSQFASKKKASTESVDNDNDNDAPDEEEIEAAAEVDPEREAHDALEIEELAEEVEQDLEDMDDLELSEAGIALGRSAMTKVCLLVNQFTQPANNLRYS
jgi:hypothetical protein